MKKRLSLVLVLMLALTWGAASAQVDYEVPKDTVTELTFWHSFTGANEELLLKQIAAFHELHPEINVHPTYIGGYNAIHTELAAANAAGVGLPGLSVINVPRLTSYAQDQVVDDLTPYIQYYADEINFDDFFDGMTTGMNYQGFQVALPFGQSGQIFYYNKTLLESLSLTFPDTIDEMDHFLKTVYEATGKTVLDVCASDNAYFYCLFCNIGDYMIDVEANATGLATENTLNLIKKIREWVDAGYVKWVFTDAGNTLLLDFTSGACASVLYTSSLYANYKDTASKGVNGPAFEVGIANQPMGVTNYQFVAGATLVIPAKAAQAEKNAAFLLAAYLTEPVNQLEWATVSSYYVTRKSASTYTEAYEAFLSTLPEMKNLDLAAYVPKTQHKLFDSCGDTFENYMAEIMNNGMDPQEGWELMVEEINDKLADQ